MPFFNNQKQKIILILLKLRFFVKSLIHLDSFPTISIKYRYSIKYKIRKFFYYGQEFYCPVCEKFVKKFAPFGTPRRLNAECPFCYAEERHRLIIIFLKRLTNFFNTNLTVLEIGPEYYFQIRFKVQKNLAYYSIDINPDIALYQMDITRMTFKDNLFDFIICTAVLEHVIDEERALNELYRVLKPGGTALISVPINKNLKNTIEFSLNHITKKERKYHFYDFHMREYGEDFRNRVENHGFNVNSLTYAKELNLKEVKLFGLIEDDGFFLCTKPYGSSNSNLKKSQFEIYF